MDTLQADIMKTYLFTSIAFEGDVLFKFDDADRLLTYDVTGAKLNIEQMVWLTEKLPRTLNELKAILKASKGAKLTEQKKQNWTFEQFWFLPDGRPRWPSNSSKKRTLKKWGQYSQRERDKAANYMETYIRNIPDGVSMLYAETYLNKELWNN